MAGCGLGCANYRVSPELMKTVVPVAAVQEAPNSYIVVDLDGDDGMDHYRPMYLANSYAPMIRAQGLDWPDGAGRVDWANRAAVEREFEPILFEIDSAELDQTARDRLADCAQWLLERPEVGVTLEGYCDPSGTEEYNYHLGAFRAWMVKDYLVGLGVASRRLFTISFGEQKIGADPQKFDADAWDRRVEIHGFILPGGGLDPEQYTPRAQPPAPRDPPPVPRIR
jgi:outer membrane protein OmpA-like peptidoglycan-associated protein